MSVNWTPARFLAKVTKGLDAAATAAAMVLSDEYRRGMGRQHGGKSSQPGAFPNSQTGNLSRSFSHVPAVNGTAYTGSSNKVAKWLNFGVVIRSKGKRLAIPLHTRAALLSRQSGGSARQAISSLKAKYPKRFVMLPGKGDGILVAIKPSARAAAKGTRVEGWYWLSRRPVHIRPRPWARLGLINGRARMAKAAVSALKEVLA